MKVLENRILVDINGGRTVEKIDLDGDGSWDVKIIEYANRTVIRYR